MVPRVLSFLDRAQNAVGIKQGYLTGRSES